VVHAAGFYNINGPVALPLEFDIPQAKPCIDERRYLFTCAFKAASEMGEIRKESRNLLHLQIVDKAR
jgi:hypothetical protein